mgnify:CR=1 FL=1|tara:strand:- start:20880 stop:21416 length:537 start_codon:yes stop_codon:yes gene_type:complete
MLRIALQIIGILILIPAVTIVTLKLDNMNADGPSILFPGGKLVSGTMHSGPEPDWSFTDDVFVIELQLEDPLASRRIFIMEYDGKVYVPSGYMKSFLGRLWKDWAFAADAGDGLGVVRINDVRYERKLIRLEDADTVAGVAAKMAAKYSGGSEAAIPGIISSIENGDTWIFELAPREG